MDYEHQQFERIDKMNENHTEDSRLPIAKKRTRSKKGNDAPMCSELERHDEYAAMGKGRAEKADRKRFLVRVTSVRCRLLDEDNLCVKLVVDCCRYAGLIPGDSAGEAKIEAVQRKIAKGETPHTVVEITHIPIDRNE